MFKGKNIKRSALKKYLEGYSESEADIAYSIKDNYDHLLVIPVYDESFTAISDLMRTPFNGQRVLFILVVNCPIDGDSQAIKRTVKLWGQLLDSIHLPSQYEHIVYAKKLSGHGLLLVDRCSEDRRIPRKQGVGLARKIGADIACDLIDKGIINSRWIHSTDADVILPSDYFCCTDQIKKHNIALVYPFLHIPESGYEVASELYDLSLRYYVESLHWAGSHYAYHTIGSLIAVDYEAYAKVRGFPKRAGGEDFYLLNKLAKVGAVLSLDEPIINVLARPSHRVPFGTGPALTKIIRESSESFVFYHPEIFKCLKQVITSLELVETQHDDQCEVHEVKCSADIFPNMNSLIIEALDSVSFCSAWHHAKAHSGNRSQDSQSHFIKHMTTWFDAFITLKFIHFLRNNFYPSVELNELKRLCELMERDDYLSPELRARIRRLTIEK